MDESPASQHRRVAIRATRDAVRQLRGGHPWLYESSVTSVGKGAEPGDLGVVFDEKRRFVAIGLLDPSSPILLRVLHQGSPQPIDDGFWRRQLEAALLIRAELLEQPHSGFRWVHGENDGLPGLVVDVYDEVLVIKLYTSAWFPHLASIIEGLRNVLGVARKPRRVAGVVLRLARNVEPTEELSDGTWVVGPEAGPLDEVEFRENGLRFVADPVRGHKTGHFLDQRDNRRDVATLAGGSRVLDVFCCTGGFTVAAAAAGARSVHSVDVSAPAIEAVAENLALNEDRISSCEWTSSVADGFTEMEELADRGRRFDLIVLDPPSFASRRADADRAAAAYRRLTNLALPLIEAGGLLVQASCSAHVDNERFFHGVRTAIERSGRRIASWSETGHAVDHPIGFAQGSYLKAVFVRLED